MTALPASLKNLAGRIDALSLRERALVFGGVLAILLVGSTNLLFGPLAAEHGRIEKELGAKLAATAALQAQVQQLARQLGQDPDEANRKRIAELKARVAQAESAFGPLDRGLVSPPEMARLVERALRSSRAIEIVKVENLPPEPVGPEPAAVPVPAGLAPAATAGVAGPAASVAPPAAPAPAIYRHGLRITMKGSYFDLARGLRAVESLPWRLLWGEVALEAGKYPQSQLSFTVHTLSFDKAWIGL